MFGFLEAASYMEWLNLEYEQRQPANARGRKECVRCGYCCAQRTCVPTPDELKGIAAFLGLAVSEMIDKYMVGDEQEGQYFLRWANKAQRNMTGEFLSNRDTFARGDCNFFDGGACRIYDTRPRDARGSNCWDGHDEFDSRKKWEDGQLERLCPDMTIDDDWDW